MKNLLVKLIKFYQRKISVFRPKCCRYFPTCSEYAINALGEWGLMGIFFIIFRLLRCNPLFKGGYDPVPQKKNRKGAP